MLTPSLSSRVRRAREFVVRHQHALSVSFLNQGVSSIANFLLGFYLVRSLSQSDYGWYTISLALCYLYGSIGNALFLTQLVVRTPDRPESDRIPYATRVLGGVAAFCLATLALALVAPALVRLAGCSLAMSTSISVATAGTSFLIKEYCVRQAYTARAERRALAVNASVAGTLCVVLAIASLLRPRLTSASALGLFAIAQSGGALVGLLLARLPVDTIGCGDIKGQLAEAWRHGKWALAGVPVTWGQAQAYAYITLFTIGPADVGRANAARLLVSPFLLLVPAVNNLVMPRLADMRAGDMPTIFRTARTLTIVMLGLACVYSAVLLFAAELIAREVLGPKYTDMRPLVAAWCVVVCATLLRDSAANVAQALKRFRLLTTSNVISATAAAASVFTLSMYWGVTGAVLGTAVGETTLAALLWRILREHETSARRELSR